MQEELENTIKEIDKGEMLIGANEIILQKETDIKCSVSNIVEIFKEYAETNNSKLIEELHNNVLRLFLDTYELDELVSQMFTVDKLEKENRIVRLFSAYEALVEYDEQAQMYWEEMAKNEEIR